MSDVTREQVKKRMMYTKGDDFYFLTYNLLVLASELKCTSERKKFVDHRKAAFLLGFVSDPWISKLVLQIKGAERLPSSSDRADLAKIYADGSARIHLLTRLLFASERKGIVSLYPGTRGHSIDFSVNVENLPEDFLASPIFEMEKTNISLLRKLMSTMRTAKLDTFLERFFSDNGVQTWHA